VVAELLVYFMRQGMPDSLALIVSKTLIAQIFFVFVQNHIGIGVLGTKGVLQRGLEFLTIFLGLVKCRLVNVLYLIKVYLLTNVWFSKFLNVLGGCSKDYAIITASNFRRRSSTCTVKHLVEPLPKTLVDNFTA